MMIIFNTPHVSEKHICFYTQQDMDSGKSEFLRLFEVVECGYSHPSVEECTWPVIQLIWRGSFLKSDVDGAKLVLLEAAQKVAGSIQLL